MYKTYKKPEGKYTHVFFIRRDFYQHLVIPRKNNLFVFIFFLFIPIRIYKFNKASVLSMYRTPGRNKIRSIVPISGKQEHFMVYDSILWRETDFDERTIHKGFIVKTGDRQRFIYFTKNPLFSLETLLSSLFEERYFKMFVVKNKPPYRRLIVLRLF